jgi:basic membrane lipoprotein Med (substrate-binding protein (PBP1-ABC) superfamily)
VRTIKEARNMKRIWSHKWLVIAGTLVIFLSIGAVAWAAGNETATATGDQAAAGLLLASTGDDGTQTQAGQGAAIRQKLKEKKQAWIQRQKALMDALRDDMTPADQSAYDRLIAAAKEQRDALKEARQALNGTLKELRELTNKYLDAGTGTTQ